MFRRLDVEAAAEVTLILDGEPVRMIDGDNLAAQLLLLDDGAFRTAIVGGEPRAAHCMIGNCFDCLVEIDGRPNQQACMTRVAEGMQVRRPR